jgi:hypothetical protein
VCLVDPAGQENCFPAGQATTCTSAWRLPPVRFDLRLPEVRLDTLPFLSLALPVSIISGLYTSSWGAFKDGPYEGFRWRTFPRSILFSVAILCGLACAPWGRGELGKLAWFQLFFLVMGVERITTEVYKACFRTERDPSLFLIPQRLTFFGRTVASRAVRVVLGAGGMAAIAAVLTVGVEVRSYPAFLGVSFATGVFVSCGGAYKDAPFEGFQPAKFFRSALVLSLASPLFYAFGPTPLGLLLFINGGLERLLVEYYKSFVMRSVPGKFRPELGIVEGEFLKHRPKLHHLSTAIVLALVVLYAWEWR